MEHAFVRIVMAYDDVKSLVAAWSQLCEKLICYEHVGEKTEKVHVHILMYNMSRSWKQFQNIMKRDFPSIHGNQSYSKKKAYRYDSFATIKYMSKGSLDPSYNKGYSQEEIATAKGSWTHEVIKKSKFQEQWERFPNFCYGHGEEYINIDFELCKNLAMDFARSEYGGVFPMPQAMNLVKSIVYTAMLELHFEIDKKHKWAI